MPLHSAKSPIFGQVLDLTGAARGITLVVASSRAEPRRDQPRIMLNHRIDTNI
jgi:hypothetical protein